MLNNIGPMELVIIFTVALLVFGPRKLPELGRSIGQMVAEFRRASRGLINELEGQVINEEVMAAEKEAKRLTGGDGDAEPAGGKGAPGDR